MTNIIDSSVQCWGCPIFDRLVSVISDAAASAYNQFALFCVLIFCVVMAFFVFDAVWKNMRNGGDPFYQKSLKPVLINSLFVFALLGMGMWLPRFISTITFEPVADITTIYTQTMIGVDEQTVNDAVTYKVQTMNADGFFRPELRNKIILLMKTTITQFQAYIKLGIAVMDSAFEWRALLGIGTLIKHILIFSMGLYLVYGFFRLFVKFCFYFADIIVAMTFFAFFLPLSLVMFVFRNSDAPGWIKSIGKNVGADQIKTLINAIITLAAAVITYTVIMVIISKFFAGHGTSVPDLMNMITTGSVTAANLSDDNIASLTLMGCVTLIYVLNFIAGEIPKVAGQVMSAFDVAEEKTLSEQLGNDALKLGENLLKTTTDIGKKVLGIEEKKEDKK